MMRCFAARSPRTRAASRQSHTLRRGQPQPCASIHEDREAARAHPPPSSPGGPGTTLGRGTDPSGVTSIENGESGDSVESGERGLWKYFDREVGLGKAWSKHAGREEARINIPPPPVRKAPGGGRIAVC